MTTCEINFRYRLDLSQHHYFRVRNYERYGNTNFVKFLHQFKQKQLSSLLCDARKSLCGGIVDEMFSETHKIILTHDMCEQKSVELTGSENRHANSIAFVGLVNGAYTACE